MSIIHTVRQGEHLSGIAYAYGFGYEQIWNHPENAALKQKRQNPNVLLPGDTVVIPDKDTSGVNGATDKQHVFVLKTPSLKLQLKLAEIYGNPIASTPCELVLAPERIALVTDSDGKVEQKIPPTVTDAFLLIEDHVEVKGSQVPFDTELTIKIGHLDPVEELSGQVARLSNLGYYRSDLSEVDAAEFKSAVEEFQCEHSLKVDGICGRATQASLKQAHGC
jgi:hypothetical protein